MTKQRISKKTGKIEPTGSMEQEMPHSSVPTTAFTDAEITTLRHVIFGYLGFLRNAGDAQPEIAPTIASLQRLHDRLPAHMELNDLIYFSHEDLVAIVEAIIGFRLLLTTCFRQTSYRDRALAEIDRLLACLMSARPLPLN